MKTPRRVNQSTSTRRLSQLNVSVSSWPSRLVDSIQSLTDVLGNPADLQTRQLCLGTNPDRKSAVLIYLNGLCNQTMIEQSILEPLLLWPSLMGKGSISSLSKYISRSISPSADVVPLLTPDEGARALLQGSALLLIDGDTKVLGFRAQGWPKRPVSTPQAEASIRGPQESFTETLQDNLAIVRRHLASVNLVVEQLTVGVRSHTKVYVLHMRGITPTNIVDEVKSRIAGINTDAMLDSGMLARFIDDRPFALIPTVRITERPDVAVAELSAGRVVLLQDSSPSAIILPATFWGFFEAAEDYYLKFHIGAFVKAMRFEALAISLFLTPLYVALTAYHQALIPLPLLLNIASTQAGVPFPMSVSAFVIEIVLEILREAGVRLPQQVGPAVSIVGAIVLGQAAIQAGFASPGLVIVIASAAIASFAVPNFEAIVALRIARFPILLLASTLGLFGLSFGLVMIVFHLASLKSFGVPMLALYTPGRMHALVDKILLSPISMRTRKRPLYRKKSIKQGDPPEISDPDELAKE